MSDSQNSLEIDLDELAARLRLVGMPSQTVVAIEAGVSQSTVSRAMRGHIKGASKGARKLWIYTSQRMPVLSVAPVGPSNALPGPLPRTRRRVAPRVELSPELNKLGEIRQRAAPLERRRAAAAVSTGVNDRGLLAEVAIAGLRDYLADAFDPLLVIEQLAVLRRAQDPALRRLPNTAAEESVA